MVKHKTVIGVATLAIFGLAPLLYWFLATFMSSLITVFASFSECANFVGEHIGSQILKKFCSQSNISLILFIYSYT